MPTAIRPIPAHESSQVRSARGGAVIRRSGEPGEAEGCSQELAALVEHALFDQPNDLALSGRRWTGRRSPASSCRAAQAAC
jgi:hypothetical protein